VSAWPLTIEDDEPGRRLVLSAEIPAFSKGLLAGIAAFIVLLVALPTLGTAVARFVSAGPSIRTLTGLALGALYPAAAAVGLVMMALRVRSVSRLAVDGPFGRIEIREFRLLHGPGAPEIIRIDDLRAVHVRSAARFARAARALPGGARAGGRDLVLTIRLLFHAGTGRPPRELQLEVEGVDRIVEGGDLALRLARALGLDHQRVVRSDPRAIEMEFSASPASHSAPAVEDLAKADYARDRVSEEAREIAARESVAPFDPAVFVSQRRLERWEPGREVRFHKPTGLAAMVCAPGLLFFLTAPAVFVVSMVTSPDYTLAGIGARVLGAGALGVFGLVPAGLALLVVATSAATTVVFDWSERRLLRQSLLSRKTVAFSELRAIELECVAAEGRSYYCRLLVRLTTDLASSKPVEIVSTLLYPDPDTSYRMALPLATELAMALRVPRVVSEEPGRRVSR
jgi:hypothetical protein